MPVGDQILFLFYMPRSVSKSKKIPSLPGANRAYGLGIPKAVPCKTWLLSVDYLPGANRWAVYVGTIMCP